MNLSSTAVWLFDLGMAEKVRPALVVSVRYGDIDRALVTPTRPVFEVPGTRFRWMSLS